MANKSDLEEVVGVSKVDEENWKSYYSKYFAPEDKEFLLGNYLESKEWEAKGKEYQEVEIVGSKGFEYFMEIIHSQFYPHKVEILLDKEGKEYVSWDFYKCLF